MGWGGEASLRTACSSMCPDLFIASAVDAGCPQVLQLWVRRSSPVLPGISDQPPEVTPFPVIPTQGPACWEALSGVWVGTSMESMAPVSLLNFEDLNTLGWTILPSSFQMPKSLLLSATG